MNVELQRVGLEAAFAELKSTVTGTLEQNCFWMSDDMRPTFVGVTGQLRAVIII